MYAPIYVLTDDPDFARFDHQRQEYAEPTWSWQVAVIVHVDAPTLLAGAVAQSVLSGDMPNGMRMVWTNPDVVAQ